MMLVAFAILAMMGWYANYSMRDKILIYYNRENKTQITRWVKMKGRYVIFDNKKFDIIPSSIVFRYYNGGLIYWLFPQWVATLFYSHNSRFPHNPNNLEVNAETPEVRNAINRNEMFLSYAKSSKPAQSKGGRQGFLDKWLPTIIALVAVGLVFWYFNSKMSGFGQVLDQVVSKLPK
jgi:hypothetical protein